MSSYCAKTGTAKRVLGAGHLIQLKIACNPIKRTKTQAFSNLCKRGIMKVTYLCTTFQVITFCFPSCEKLHPPVIQVQHVSFKYQEDKVSARVLNT